MPRFSPHIPLAHAYWKQHLRFGDIAIDATCGNGHDTIALAMILLNDPKSLVIALDIQQSALDQTLSLLLNNFPEPVISRVIFHRHNHADIDLIPLPSSPRLIVYNLGYLPGGDKTLTTQTKTTMQSLDKAIHLLAQDGALSITCYPGHEEGEKEHRAILEWAKKRSPSRWRVCYHSWINRQNAPTFFWIQSIDGEHRS